MNCFYKPDGNHKGKTYYRYTKVKEKEKRIKTYNYRKWSNHKGRQEEDNRTEKLNSQKINKMKVRSYLEIIDLNVN